MAGWGQAVECPVVEGPAVEGPAVEGPVVEGPAGEAPTVGDSTAGCLACLAVGYLTAVDPVALHLSPVALGAASPAVAGRLFLLLCTSSLVLLSQRSPQGSETCGYIAMVIAVTDDNG